MDTSVVSKQESISIGEHFFVTERHLDQGKKNLKLKTENFFRRGGKLSKDDGITYSVFLPIYKMWLEYFNNVMRSGNCKMDERLLKIDYHGCLLLVTHANNKCNVGVNGFVVHESRQTFQLVTKENKIKTIPKKDTIFQFVVNNKIYILFGNGIQLKSFIRGRKPKSIGQIPFLIC
ncbi:Ribonuclease P protein subunit p29 [Strongyloides ratti]|uniref:Ribonuclease P protein subunit p29 n=1 Tax=Strongyloides ratti TaxID=34506 RepID=A0A090MXR9_STRRB|nr:Ribonuclease P protein subunit p29 [Strongyloides ratti]CEF65914.1 Ribonuclease P protein subunit p29 [Strongyloides ratti]